MPRAVWDQAVGHDLVAALPDELVRHRLIDRLAARWDVPVVVIEAPGGFGKSTLLAQALRANLAAAAGVDLYLACRESDRDAPQITRRILELTGSPLPGPLPSTTEDAARLLADGLARLAPVPVALMLDDLHRLRPDDETVQLLGLLIRSQPANVHLVLSGRTIPPLPLTRLVAADQVIRISQADLVFDTNETAALAQQHGTGAEGLAAAGGWPALTRLALVVGGDASLDYLLEEVVHGLDPATRTALAAAVLGRVVDDATLAEVAGTPVQTRDLLARVPLVSPADVPSAGWGNRPGTGTRTGGAVRVHDLWAEALPRLLPAEELRRLALAFAQWHLSHDRYEEALEAAIAVGDWDQASTVTVRTLEVGGARLRAASTARWIAAFPADQHDRPELLLLRAATRRMDGDLEGARALADAALEHFRRVDDPRAIAAAAMEVGLTSWLASDIGRLLEMVGVGEGLQAQGVTSMNWMLDMAYAGFADLQGDAHRALELVERIDVAAVPDRAAQLVMRWRCVLSMAVGDSAAAVAHAGRLEAEHRTPMVQLLVDGVHWQHGDPERLLARHAAAARPAALGNTLDDFLTGAYQAVVEASLGMVADTDRLAAIAPDRPRDRAYLAIATAAAAVARGDEPAAGGVIEALLDEVGVDEPQCRAELRRFVALCHPLSDRAAAALDADELGPRLVQRRELARLFRDARRGDEVDWSRLPSPADVLTGLPLRWSLELAIRAAAAGDDRGTALADYLLDAVGAPAHQLLQELRDDPRLPPAGRTAVVAHVPPLPSGVVRVAACGPLAVEADPPPPSGLLRRARVRELLALLILRDRVTATEAIEMLWPGLGADGGRNNLRVTLRYLRQLLEPDRAKGEPSFHVRRQGELIWLTRSRWLQVDVWEMREALTRGRQLDQQGRLAAAITEYRRAVDAWRGEVLPDVRDHHQLAPTVTYLDLELAEAAARTAEWCLAQGDNDGARTVAERLLDHDPYAERAHAVIVGAHLARAEVAAAGEALEQCRAALAELDVPPGPATTVLFRRFEHLLDARRR